MICYTIVYYTNNMSGRDSVGTAAAKSSCEDGVLFLIRLEASLVDEGRTARQVTSSVREAPPPERWLPVSLSRGRPSASA